MKFLIRRHMLALIVGVTAAVVSLSVEVPAYAKDGGGESSGSGSGSSGSGGGGGDSSGSGGDSSGHGGDNSGSGSDNSGHGGDDGPGHNAGDDHGRRHGGHGADDSNDDSRDDNGGGGRRADRPSVQISVDAATRAGLLNGTLVAVDNLGRALEVETDVVNGRSVLTAKPHGGDAKRNPGPITSVDVVAAANAPVHQ